MPNFPKIEKLCSLSVIQTLRTEGKRFNAWPLRAVYSVVSVPNHQVLLWAPKALFKHAVDRNLLRRRMRESYRLHKDILPQQPTYHIAIYYTDKQIQPSAVIESAMVKILTHLAKV